MRRQVVAAVAGIALLALGGIAVVMLATSDRSPPAPAAEPRGPEIPRFEIPPDAPRGSIDPARIPGGMAALKFTPPPTPPPAPPPPPPEGSWEAVPPSARPAALGAVGGAVGRALLELKPRLDACFDEESQARHGPRQPTAVKDRAPIESATTTILMLQIEEGDGSARIVDAPVESQGRASDGLVSCAQQVLRGQVVEVPGAKAGRRHRLLHPLMQ